MCGYFCILFIDFLFEGKSLVDFTNLFSPYDFKRNDEIVILMDLMRKQLFCVSDGLSNCVIKFFFLNQHHYSNPPVV